VSFLDPNGEEIVTAAAITVTEAGALTTGTAVGSTAAIAGAVATGLVAAGAVALLTVEIVYPGTIDKMANALGVGTITPNSYSNRTRNNTPSDATSVTKPKIIPGNNSTNPPPPNLNQNNNDNNKSNSPKKAEELIHGRLKRSESYHSNYADKTFDELTKLSKSGDKNAKDMLKLIKQTPRLMEKIR